MIPAPPLVVVLDDGVVDPPEAGAVPPELGAPEELELPPEAPEDALPVLPELVPDEDGDAGVVVAEVEVEVVVVFVVVVAVGALATFAAGTVKDGAPALLTAELAPPHADSPQASASDASPVTTPARSGRR